MVNFWFQGESVNALCVDWDVLCFSLQFLMAEFVSFGLFLVEIIDESYQGYITNKIKDRVLNSSCNDVSVLHMLWNCCL